MRTILHIDMNSYFASVAAQMNPFLRGKAIGVGGKPGTRGIIAAASREAKLRGVKTAMNAYEALRVCPELQIVDGDMDAVLDCTKRFLKIFRRYTDAVEVFSVDEAFLDLTDYSVAETLRFPRRGGLKTSATIQHAIQIAQSIKRDLRAELGECITCSVGIAPNKLLAKLASGMKKPDGLVVLEKIPGDMPCTELCGIGPRVGLRLQTLGIHTIADLGRAEVGRLIDEFGPVMGYQLHQMGLGEDNSPVVSAESDPKSFGNSYTLLKDSTDREELRQILYALTVKMTARMRSEGFSARAVSGWIRYHDFTHEGGRARLAAPSADPLMIFRAIWQTIKVHLGLVPVRLLGVHATDLTQGGEQLSLLNSVARDVPVPHSVCDRSAGACPPLCQAAHKGPRYAVLQASDAINSRYGPHTLEPASLLRTTLRRHVSGFKHLPAGRQVDKLIQIRYNFGRYAFDRRPRVGAEN